MDVQGWLYITHLLARALFLLANLKLPEALRASMSVGTHTRTRTLDSPTAVSLALPTTCVQFALATYPYAAYTDAVATDLCLVGVRASWSRFCFGKGNLLLTVHACQSKQLTQELHAPSSGTK